MFLVVNFVQSIWSINWLSSLALILNFSRTYSSYLPFLSRSRCCICRSRWISLKMWNWRCVTSLILFHIRVGHVANSIKGWLLYNRWWISMPLRHHITMAGIVNRHSKSIPSNLLAWCYWLTLVTSLAVCLIINFVSAVLPKLFLNSRLSLMRLLLRCLSSKLLVRTMLLSDRA